MKTYGVFLIGLFLVILWFYQRRCGCGNYNNSRVSVEGFAEKPTPAPPANVVSSQVFRILNKTTSLLGALAKPSTWTDRIALRGKTPVEMARAYLNSNKNV